MPNLPNHAFYFQALSAFPFALEPCFSVSDWFFITLLNNNNRAIALDEVAAIELHWVFDILPVTLNKRLN
jgi:hypothetical protein